MRPEPVGAMMASAEDVGQPGQAQSFGQAGERAEDALEVHIGPSVGQGVLGESPDEDHLQQHVDGGTDQHGEDHRPGHVPLRVLALPSQLDGLLEADQGEDRATVAHCPEYPVQPERGEAVAGEIGRVEAGEEEDHDRHHRHDDLPGGDGVVGPDQVPDTEQVGHHEEGHHHGGHEVAQSGEDGHPGRDGGQAVPVVAGVGDGRLDLDGGGPHRLQPGEPAERSPGQAAEGVVREPGGPPADREHPAQLGVHEGQQDDGHRADEPGDDGGRPADGGTDEGPEQPARPDDRTFRGEQEPDEPDVAGQAIARGGGRYLSHGPPLLRSVNPRSDRFDHRVDRRWKEATPTPSRDSRFPDRRYGYLYLGSPAGMVRCSMTVLRATTAEMWLTHGPTLGSGWGGWASALHSGSNPNVTD